MSLTKQTVQKVLVAGKGENKTTAFANALAEVSKKVMKDSAEVLLRIEPKQVQLVTAKSTTVTERFLWFFLPRKRTTYYVQLEVEVAIQSIAVQEVPFHQSIDEQANKQLIPFLSKKI
ncbi:DUF4312 family protein [Enterococcus faecalis]